MNNTPIQFTGENYRQKKIQEWKENKDAIKVMKPVLETIALRQENNCDNCQQQCIKSSCNCPCHF